MSGHLNEAFLQHPNQHLGIAHKVGRLYGSDAEDRQDLLQEMMYQLWRSFANFDGRSKFSTWMYRVCLNTALTYCRKNKRTRHGPLSPTHQQLREPNADPREDTTTMLYEAITAPIQRLQALLDEFRAEA